MIAVMLLSFFLLATLGMPLAFAIGCAAVAGMLWDGMPLVQLASKMVHSIDSFPLMAIPLFALAGQLMIKGGVMEPLIDLANAIVGRVRGGLAHVTIVTAMGLSSVSGTAVADAVALGGTLGPALGKAYSRPWSASLVAAASCLGPIIPPSSNMIVYAVVVGTVSVGGLFMAGVVPGILIGLALMLYATVVAYRRGYPPTGEPFSLLNLVRQIRRSILIVLMPVVVIGGIVIGAFTATEGAAIAVGYALLIGFGITRQLKLADLPGALLNAGIISAVVGALIAFSSVVTYIFTLELFAEALADFLRGATTSPLGFLSIVMAMLFVAGMFMEANALIIMLAPLLAPIAAGFGLDPLLFGFLFCLNITLGSITPPVGILLFVVSSIWRLSFEAVAASIWPFIVIEYAALVLCILVPGLVLTLPRAMGF
jgi:tripartite ATP-independent transporter DctM subunit